MLPDGSICRRPLGLACLRGCLRGLDLRLALSMYWRRAVTRKVERVLVPSSYLEEEAERNSIPRGKVRVIPHFTGKNPGGIWKRPEEGFILFVGRVDPLKGIGELIRALGLIKNLEWRAHIVGAGEGLEAYGTLAEKAGVGGRINFSRGVGPDEVDEYYQKASVVVFPSMSVESFGLVGIEAMSFGRPVVAFDSRGPGEWLKDGETGFLVRRGDVEALARRIRRLLEDRELAEEMGRKGMETVKRLYRKDAHVERLLGVYGEAVEGWKRGAVP